MSQVNEPPLVAVSGATQPPRYRAFISYSQRDKPIARRIHRALETYRIPSGIVAPVGPNRALGRFFRDDEEMGASQSLGRALEGALDDSENLIVICSPSAAQSTWVDAEVRRFKRRGTAHIFAVIVAGKPHASDPSQECFPPSLKVKIGPDGNSTGEPDEPRAPDLDREGLQRVKVQLAAGLLNIPFDTLWQRDRRRTLRNRMVTAAASLVLVVVLAVVGFGWLSAQRDARTQAARQATGLARNAAADGRVGEALTRLAPFLEQRDTRELVEGPLRALLGWIPDPYKSIKRNGFIPARLRDATVLLDPGRGVYDVSDVGVKLERLIRSRDGQRLVVIGDQRVVVFDLKTGQRLSQVNNSEVQWMGHGFESPRGLIVVTGAVVGSTNSSVTAHVLSIAADGRTSQTQAIPGAAFSSTVAITPKCDALLVAIEGSPNEWRIERREFGEQRIGDPANGAPSETAPGSSNDAGLAALTPLGSAFATRDAFLGEAKLNPFTSAGCPALAMDDGFAAGTQQLQGVQVVTLEPGLSFEPADRWKAVAAADKPPASTYLSNCTEAQPCRVAGTLLPTGAFKQETYVREDSLLLDTDYVGAPPAPRWSRKGAPAGEQISFDHRVSGPGHRLAICRPKDGKDVCLLVTIVGEEQLQLPFLRSPDGRYLFWPFAGAVFDLETLQPLTESRAIPTTPGMHFDFELDRPGLTLALEGRLVTFVADAASGKWIRIDKERASPPFGVLPSQASDPPLHTLASLGNREYLAVRNDGVLARLDSQSGREVWRIAAVGLGEIQDVQLNPERQHVLLMGKNAWRLFRLSDGFALSGFLAPPPALDKSTSATSCKLHGVIGPEGQLVARCGKGAFAWQPQVFTGEIAPRLTRLTCAADLKTSALDTIRRCYVNP